MELDKIKVGDTLTLSPIDGGDVITETVTSTHNPDCDELYFSIRTQNLDYDFLNFYDILSVKN